MASNSQDTAECLPPATGTERETPEAAAPWSATGEVYVTRELGEGHANGDVEVNEDSDEAQACYDRFEELTYFWQVGRYAECEEGCMELLLERGLPPWVRIQSYQMLSTMASPGFARDCLEEAGIILDSLDHSNVGTQFLRGENEQMLLDLELGHTVARVRGNNLLLALAGEMTFFGPDFGDDSEQEDLSGNESGAEEEEER